MDEEEEIEVEIRDPDRDAIHALLSDFGGPDAGMEGLLMGWVCVSEWMLPDEGGRRLLIFLSGDTNGDPAPTWQSVGYLRNGLQRVEPIYLARERE